MLPQAMSRHVTSMVLIPTRAVAKDYCSFWVDKFTVLLLFPLNTIIAYDCGKYTVFSASVNKVIVQVDTS